MRGTSHHGLLKGATWLGPAVTAPGFDLFDLGSYPAMTEGEGVVHGELYEVEDALLPRLDAYEEHPEVYRRRFIHLADGRRVESYLLPPALAAGHPRIPSGQWNGPSG